MKNYSNQSQLFLHFFERDLMKMKEEILLYRNEKNLWLVKGTLSNSAGNLFLHVLGNLRHFIGATLGNTGYLRNRDKEFNEKNVPLNVLIEEFDRTIEDIKTGLNGLSNERMCDNFPLEKHGEVVSIEYMLQHLLTHLNYHLGQVNYHRRFLED